MIFSIIIPTFNRAEVLRKTLECLENQQCGFPYEVIVVDDYPASILPDLGFGKGKRTSWRLLRNIDNLGRAATRNRGIKEASGQYILFLDDDIWAVPQLLQAHYAKQMAIEGGVVAGAAPVHPDMPHDAVNDHYRAGIERLYRQMLEQANDLPYNYFFTGNVSVPKRAVVAAGMFDETFKAYSCEDTELGYRLHKSGLRFVYAPEAVGWHRHDETLNTYLGKAEDRGSSAYIFARLHPEVAEEISVAGLLAPGNRSYQTLLNKPVLTLMDWCCHITMIVKNTKTTFHLLEYAYRLHYAYGLKKAFHG